MTIPHTKSNTMHTTIICDDTTDWSQSAGQPAVSQSLRLDLHQDGPFGLMLLVERGVCITAIQSPRQDMRDILTGPICISKAPPIQPCGLEHSLTSGESSPMLRAASRFRCDARVSAPPLGSATSWPKPPPPSTSTSSGRVAYHNSKMPITSAAPFASIRSSHGAGQGLVCWGHPRPRI